VSDSNRGTPQVREIVLYLLRSEYHGNTHRCQAMSFCPVGNALRGVPGIAKAFSIARNGTEAVPYSRVYRF
jgi:hypothetical protein